jgi:hypothetical protein
VYSLEPSVSAKLASITIVGMRHHANSFDKIIAASSRPVHEQLLFLVPDVNNRFDKNAVMLHDGQNKLGYVAAREVPQVKEIIDELSKQAGQDQVLVVEVQPVINPRDFSWSSSFNARVVGAVYERIARKCAQGD